MCGWWLSEVGVWLSEPETRSSTPLFKKPGGFRGVARPLGTAWRPKAAVFSFQLAGFSKSLGKRRCERSRRLEMRCGRSNLRPHPVGRLGDVAENKYIINRCCRARSSLLRTRLLRLATFFATFRLT